MRVIVCGSRDWDDFDLIATMLTGMAVRYRRLTVVHGAARGADNLAGQWCRSTGVTEEPHYADWAGQGRAAGPIRNRLMLDLGADLVIAFKDGFDHSLQSGGTENMIKIAREDEVPTVIISH